MLKRLFACALALTLTVFCTTSVLAAATEDSIAPQGDNVPAYSVVSAVVNREYDFKDDFHDSYPYDEDFYTEGIFELDDYKGDVTLKLKNNSTGQEFVFEPDEVAEWSVKASIDHLLYETTQIDAAVHIYDLGGDYGIQDVDVPVTITVVSSQYSADFHKYPSYQHSYMSMTEGVDFSVDSVSPDGTATLTLLKEPWLFFLDVYNVETGERESHDTDNSNFVFPTQVKAYGFDPSKKSFWFFFPAKLIMDDGYELEFTMSVDGRLKNPATSDSADNRSTADSASGDSASKPGSGKNTANAVKTGEASGLYILAGVCLTAAALLALFSRKRKRV